MSSATLGWVGARSALVDLLTKDYPSPQAKFDAAAAFCMARAIEWPDDADDWRREGEDYLRKARAKAPCPAVPPGVDPQTGEILDEPALDQPAPDLPAAVIHLAPGWTLPVPLPPPPAIRQAYTAVLAEAATRFGPGAHSAWQHALVRSAEDAFNAAILAPEATPAAVHAAGQRWLQRFEAACAAEAQS